MKLFLVPLAAIAMLLSACAEAESDDGRPTIVASFYPFAFVAERVGGSLIQIENLTSPGVEPHDIELAPQQVAEVQDADLVIFESGFQSAVDDAVGQAGRSQAGTVDMSDLVTESSTDPHTWLNPQNMVTLTRAVADAMSAADPTHADEFQQNADALVADLEELDTAFIEGLKTCERRTIVTSHSAFAYLAEQYDLTQVPIAGLDPSTEPSPRDIAEITALVRREKITTIFTEELVSPAIARTVADESGVTIATLDPVEGLGPNTSDQTYLTLMSRNLEALRTANSCQ